MSKISPLGARFLKVYPPIEFVVFVSSELPCFYTGTRSPQLKGPTHNSCTENYAHFRHQTSQKCFSFFKLQSSCHPKRAKYCCFIRVRLLKTTWKPRSISKLICRNVPKCSCILQNYYSRFKGKHTPKQTFLI